MTYTLSAEHDIELLGRWRCAETAAREAVLLGIALDCPVTILRNGRPWRDFTPRWPFTRRASA